MILAIWILAVLLIASNWLWYVFFTSYRNEVIRQVAKLRKKNQKDRAISKKRKRALTHLQVVRGVRIGDE